MSRSPAVILYDSAGVALAVQDGVAIPASTPALLIAGKDGGTSRFAKVDAAGRLEENVGAWFGATTPTVGQKATAASLPVTMASDQPTIGITFSLSGLGVLALPKLVHFSYSKSDGAIVAIVYKRVATYTIPNDHNGYLIRYSSFQNEAAASRIVAQTQMGTLSIATNTYAAGSSYTAPAWVDVVQADVTTALTAGAGNVVVTVTYTNHEGTASRTGTITIPKGSAVGSRWALVLQAGDIGIRSIQNMSVSPTLAAGAITMLGLINLCVHQDQSTTTQAETVYAPGGVSFPASTVLGLEYAGGTVSKLRSLSALIQLIPI